MRSIERKFNEISQKNLRWSSWTCFVNAIKGQKFNKRTVREWFEKLVNKNDFDKDEKKQLLKYLSKISNTAEDNQK